MSNLFEVLSNNIDSFFSCIANCSSIEMLGWMTACISLTGAFLNAQQKWYSFLVWMIANVSWIVYDLYNACYAQAALFTAYLLMNVYGLYCWKFKTSSFNK